MELATQIGYVPIIKPKRFCPNPIAVYGIPEYANSDPYFGGNPLRLGTLAHKQWWDEQFDRCINGYNAQGLFISGRYYYYLNFFWISSVGIGKHRPSFVDFDYEFFNLIEQIKANNQGLIAPKSRRKGVTFKTDCIVDHGFRFFDGYHAGVCAGISDYSDGWYKKFLDNFYDKPPELQLNLLYKRTDNSSDQGMKAGWRERTFEGKQVEKGSLNLLMVKTMKQDANVFRGEHLDDLIFEEAQEFANLAEAFEASKHCFMLGNMMYGTPYIYGTGGSKNKAFEEMYYNAEAFNLVPLFVHRARLYYPCFVNDLRDRSGEIKTDTPNLNHFKEYERYGMEDVDRAEELILLELERLKKSNNPEKLLKFQMEMPGSVEQAFMRLGTNNFDSELLGKQHVFLKSSLPLYTKYHLEFKRKEDGTIIQPYEVYKVPLSDEEISRQEYMRDINYIMIHNDYDQMSHLINQDVAGVDSYNQDFSITSKSLGAMVVIRRKIIEGKERRIPIGLIYGRPRRKEKFYELCFKASVYFGLLGNTMIDAHKDLIFKFYTENAGEQYLAPRPLAFDSPNSEAIYSFGTKITPGNKERFIGIIQSWIMDDIELCVFPQIMQDLINYDEGAKESDCDSADALGLGLVQCIELKNKPFINLKDTELEELMRLPRKHGSEQIYADDPFYQYHRTIR